MDEAFNLTPAMERQLRVLMNEHRDEAIRGLMFSVPDGLRPFLDDYKRRKRIASRARVRGRLYRALRRWM